MVRILAGLKARLFWNGLRSDRQRQIGLPLIATLFGWLGWNLSHSHAGILSELTSAARVEYLAWAALVVFIAWIALPVVIFPLDENLDPQQLAALPISRPRLVAGLTAAAGISVPVLGLLAVIGTTLGFQMSTLWLTLPAGVLFLIMLLVGSQTFTTLISAVLHSRRGRDVAVFLVMGIGLSSFAGYQAIRTTVSDLGLSRAVMTHALDHVWWLIPPAAPAHAISSAWEGAWVESLVALVVSTIWIGALVTIWERVLRWLLITPKQESAPAVRHHRRGLANGRWEVPFMMARKEFRFYLRDPRQRLVWTGTVIFVGLAVAAIVVGAEGLSQVRTGEWLPMMAPVLVLMVGLPIGLNQFGWERNAASYLFALPAKPRAVLMGKNLAATTGLLIETIFLAALLAWFASAWRWFGLVIPVAMGAICCLLAVGNVVSVLAPLRLPREGTDMFAQATEQGFLALISQVVSFFAIGLLLVLPASVTVLTISFGEVIPPWFAALFSILWGSMWYGASLAFSGWLLRRRVPEVVAWVQVY